MQDTIYLTGKMEVINQINDDDYAVRLKVMREGVNRNKWDFQNVREYYKTFVGRWILCAYVGSKVGDGHNMREVLDARSGKKYYTFTDATSERIVGAISENPDKVTLVEENGELWIVAEGRISKFYCRELVEQIVELGVMELSAEIRAIEEHKSGDIDVYTVWSGLGVTVLGEGVAPAIPGATIKALAAIEEEFETAKLRAASLRAPEQGPQNPDDGGAKKTKTHERVTHKMSKKLIAQMQQKFPGYTVIAVDGDNVALLSESGDSAYIYTFNAEDGGEVVAARIQPVMPVATFAYNESSIDVSVMDALDVVSAQLIAANGQMATLTAELESANATLAAMQTAEHNRRIEAVKNAVKNEAIETRAVWGDESTADFEATVASNAEKYAVMEDANGVFVGDKEATKEFAALCAQKKRELDKADQLAKNSATVYAWEGISNKPTEPGDIMGLVAEICNQ